MAIKLGIITGALSIIFFLYGASKEKHYILRDNAVINGLILIGNGIALLITQPTIYFANLPLALFPIVHGFLGIGLTVKKTDKKCYTLRSLVCAVMAGFIVLVQFGIIG